MWRPALCGDVIVCGCSSLGIFAYDKHTYAPLWRLELPGCAGMEIRDDPKLDGVTGFAALGNSLYITTTYADLYVFDTGSPLPQCEHRCRCFQA